MNLRKEPALFDRLIQLMAFVKEEEARLGRKWTPQDWKYLEAVVHAKEENT